MAKIMDQIKSLINSLSWILVILIVLSIVLVIGYGINLMLYYDGDGYISNVNAGVLTHFNEEKHSVIVEYTAKRNADFVRISFSGWGGRAVGRLVSEGDSISLSPHQLNTTKNASVEVMPSTLPKSGDTISVKVIAIKGQDDAVVLTKEGPI